MFSMSCGWFTSSLENDFFCYCTLKRVNIFEKNCFKILLLVFRLLSVFKVFHCISLSLIDQTFG